MLRLQKQIAAIAIALISINAPALAEEPKEGAKGLFFEQLNKPKENINTGVRYWIELDTGNGPRRVSNKTAFHSGDKIRFHVSANIDGYAYIVLASGSQGEQSVLFPDKRFNDNNKIERGKEYSLPADDPMQFDRHPGLEKVMLLVSREPIDAMSYIAKPTETPIVIASAQIGSKDLVPAQVVISYAPENTTPRPYTEPKHTVSTMTVAKTSEDDGVTTVIKKSPGGVLYVNVDLDHRS
jgi:hypothetical protein